jgi:hypothetical protein
MHHTALPLLVAQPIEVRWHSTQHRKCHRQIIAHLRNPNYVIIGNAAHKPQRKNIISL